jgi:hypothetical protein
MEAEQTDQDGLSPKICRLTEPGRQLLQSQLGLLAFRDWATTPIGEGVGRRRIRNDK